MTSPRPVEFELTLEDYARFNVHVCENNRGLRAQQRRMLVAMWVLMAAFAAIFRDIASLSVALAGGLLFTATQRWTRRNAVRRAARLMVGDDPVPGLLGPQSVEIRPDGVHTTNDVRDCHTRWHGITSVERTPTDVYLWMGSVQALIIPAHAFASHAELDAFVESTSGFHTQAMLEHVSPAQLGSATAGRPTPE